MTFCKRKGWRRIVVQVRVFYWRAWFSGCPCCHSDDAVLVRPNEQPSRLFRVIWGTGRLTPGVVRLAIEEALARGWPDDLPALRLRSNEIPGLCSTPATRG
jgi:hypothetical protein